MAPDLRKRSTVLGIMRAALRADMATEGLRKVDEEGSFSVRVEEKWEGAGM